MYGFIFASDIYITPKAFSSRSTCSSLQQREQKYYGKLTVCFYTNEVAW